MLRKDNTVNNDRVSMTNCSPGCLLVDNMPDNAGDIGDAGLIPGWKDSLEGEMATYSSILAWRIPWTEEPGGLQSMGSQSRTRLSISTNCDC